MFRKIVFIVTLVTPVLAFAQHTYDNCDQALALALQGGNFCSTTGQYNNVGATNSTWGPATGWPSNTGRDVWFRFTAEQYDLSITVTGSSPSTSGGTLQAPLIALYRPNDLNSPCTGFAEQVSSFSSSNNIASLYKGALTPGQMYYIRVSAENNNTGTFTLCINNYKPPLRSGQDNAAASLLCSKESFTQTSIVGAGTNNRESAGTCLDNAPPGTPIESNATWYKWTAANNGKLTFTITPILTNDDIDWVLYDLGPGGTLPVSAANAIRCAAGHGVNNSQCTNEALYYKTGTNLTSSDSNEAAGCGQGQDGFVKAIDMIQGHVYALLINNFTSDKGFKMDFGGDGEFLGPQSSFSYVVNQSCTPGQSYTFTHEALRYTKLVWRFGADASLDSFTGDDPPPITYSTLGTKTVVLEAYNAQGCFVISTQTFRVALKPPIPVIQSNKPKFCIGDTIMLSTAPMPNMSYSWTGPNNFTSDQASISIPVNSTSVGGVYTLVAIDGHCTSDPATITIPPVLNSPVVAFTYVVNQPCTVSQNYVFTHQASDYSRLVWRFGSGASLDTSALANPPPVTYSTLGPKTVVLEAYNANGCVVIASQSFTVALKPAAPVIQSNKPRFCIGDTIILSTTPLPNTTYIWTGPNNFTSSQASISIPVNNTNLGGVYSLVAIEGACTSNPSAITIPPVLNSPVSAFTFVENLSCTINENFVFTSQSSGHSRLVWRFGVGASLDSSALANPPPITYSSPGTKTVMLEAYNANGCVVITSQSFAVGVRPAIPVIQSNKAQYCLGDTIRLSTAPFPNTTYRWTGPNNFTSDQTSISLPVTNTNLAGTYRLIATQGNCDSNPATIVVPPVLNNPVAAFRTSPSLPAKLSSPITIRFFNQSTNADTYLWDFGDSTTSTDINPVHTFTVGEYDVTLTAFRSNVCNNSVTKGKFIINADNTLFVPNTFTPNGDTVNDEFVVTISNILNYRISIFNRWGTPLFAATSIFDNWTGMYNGSPLPVGTYYYQIDAVDLKGNAIKKGGSITLLR